MAAGRPRKPTALKLIEGNRGKRALKRGEPMPPVPMDLEPPPTLSAEAAEVWREYAPKLRRAGLLSELDTHALEDYCNAVVFRRQEIEALRAEGSVVVSKKSGVAYTNPRVNSYATWAKRTDAGESKFGLSPSAKARIEVGPQLGLFDDQPPGKPAGTERFFAS